MQAHHVIHKGQWNLHIRNVSINDSGAYECQVSTKTRDIRRAFFLTVKGMHFFEISFCLIFVEIL